MQTLQSVLRQEVDRADVDSRSQISLLIGKLACKLHNRTMTIPYLSQAAALH
ncbi:hypothetical protein [Rhodoferax antarcticus]|uniref:Uncharacterized protein n=1 Tax=Rhodoferax antarcticus ANT.BR TaxID=1111071 RepID=A0A1Q8YF20_9BURK|nr:hypothetical protein [Rhodoferax antarcticus]MCW2313077.1 hypothetical protein [Rhodoferax antarcticus]OLP06470.1 hypothetical protein BLL52_2706 [Rhodoferax antarcticus ANT.BR]